MDLNILQYCYVIVNFIPTANPQSRLFCNCWRLTRVDEVWQPRLRVRDHTRHWTHGRSAKPDTGAVTSTVRKYIVSWCTRARTPPNIYNIRTSSSISWCYVLLSTLLLRMRPDSHLNVWSNNIGTTVRIRETFPSKSMYSTSLFVIVSNTIIQFLRKINPFYKTVHVR